MQPVIGITGSGLSEVPARTAHYDAFYTSPALYSQCVARAGGIPVVLPPLDGDCDTLLNRLDGIIFTGGTDINPALYGGDEQHPNLFAADTNRDRAEQNLIRHAVERKDLPILCICRGMQMLNVVLGGTLTEHVPDLGRGDMHRDDKGLWVRHDVAVEEKSRLARAIGTETVNTTSGHHQALHEVAAGLTVAATAADGIVEAVELESHPWCLAVQWHPELTAHADRTQQALFDELVRVAQDA
ncbi:gamma-glutamyl-gamma-aminobutyrate hydrolase family protein [Coralliovum pocilloporae]|uniref:gamma-glutamyl-gamma-aminobutyrate hydrolase family protein n=1 Tax=Coralliovum pocilloporae TaxID=3066369 RepID=UPI0033076F5F